MPTWPLRLVTLPVSSVKLVTVTDDDCHSICYFDFNYSSQRLAADHNDNWFLHMYLSGTSHQQPPATVLY